MTSPDQQDQVLCSKAISDFDGKFNFQNSQTVSDVSFLWHQFLRAEMDRVIMIPQHTSL